MNKCPRIIQELKVSVYRIYNNDKKSVKPLCKTISFTEQSKKLSAISSLTPVQSDKRVE